MAMVEGLRRPRLEGAAPRAELAAAPPDREKTVLHGFLGPVRVVTDKPGRTEGDGEVPAVEFGEGDDVIVLHAGHQLLVADPGPSCHHSRTSDDAVSVPVDEQNAPRGRTDDQLAGILTSIPHGLGGL